MIRNDVEYAAVQDRPISHEIKPPLEFQVELVALLADLEAVLALATIHSAKMLLESELTKDLTLFCWSHVCSVSDIDDAGSSCKSKRM